MNKVVKLLAVVALGSLLMFSACKRVEKQVEDTLEADLTAMSNQPENEITEDDVLVDETTADIEIEGEGIAADFWVEAEDLDLVQGPAGGFDSSRRNAMVRNRSFIKCLSGLNLTDSQRKEIKMDIRDFVDCRNASIKEARALYAKLRATYRGKYEVLLKKLKDGALTRDQFAAAVKELRRAFLNDVRLDYIKIKLYANLRVCHLKLLRQLHLTLSPAQWKAFVACYKK